MLIALLVSIYALSFRVINVLFYCCFDLTLVVMCIFLGVICHSLSNGDHYVMHGDGCFHAVLYGRSLCDAAHQCHSCK